MKNIVLVAALSFLLVGCASSIDVNTVPTNPPALMPDMPDQASLNDVDWQVLTQVQIQELAKSNDPNVVLYALDADSFRNLALNMAEIQRYLEQQKNVIISYKNYYENKTAADAKKKAAKK